MGSVASDSREDCERHSGRIDDHASVELHADVPLGGAGRVVVGRGRRVGDGDDEPRAVQGGREVVPHAGRVQDVRRDGRAREVRPIAGLGCVGHLRPDRPGAP